MNRLALTIFIFTSFAGISQVSTFEKKGKFGIKNGEEVILKPKYDSILLADPEVSSAFKKNKLYFIKNVTGETIYKGKSEYLEVFRHGAGITTTKKHKTGAIDANGEHFIEPWKFNRLSYKLGLLHLIDSSYYKKYKLYAGSQLISENANRIEILNDWVIVHRTETESHTHTPTKGIFKKRRTTTTTTSRHWMEIYDGYSGFAIDKNVDEITSYDDMVGLKGATDFDLYLKGDKIIERVTFMEAFNDSLWEGSTQKKYTERKDGEAEDRFLLDKKTKQIVVHGPHIKFDINENTIYGHGDTDNLKNIYIYDLNGKLIRNDLKGGWKIDELRFIFSDSLGEFIANETGEQLSKHYSSISDASEGIRRVFHDYSYGYINDSTYEELAINWPVVGEKISYSGGGGRRRGLFRGLGRDLGNFGRRLIGQPTKGRASGYSSTGKSGPDVIILDDGHDFSNGMAIVCLNGLKRDAKYDSIYAFYENDAIYNYISTSGKLMSTKKYTHCFPFKNDQAWAKYGKYYSIINNKGKTIKATKYTDIEEDEFGFLKVKKAGKWGVINTNGESMLPCDHAILTYKDGGYYSKYDGQEKFELRVSN